MRKEIVLFKVFMSEDVKNPINEVLMSGFIGQGQKVEQFEKMLRDKFGVNYLVSLNSATSGLHLALHLLKQPTIIGDRKWDGLQEGDEVLTSPLTCTATNMPILANNLSIKWVDIDKNTLNMDLDDLARKITCKTKAIMVVHWGGYPVDLDKLKKIQTDAEAIYGFKPVIIEDCSHAFGSKFDDKLIGSHGNICVFSFQAIKHFTTIDGGMIIFPHEDIYKRAKLMRWYGIDREGPRIDFRCEQNILEYGFKFHMNDVNATIGISNLPHSTSMIEKHKSNAKYYDENLKNVNRITLLERNDKMESTFWLYSILVERKIDFMRYMKENGIMVSQVHERNDRHTCFSAFRTQLPTLDNVIPKLVSIPVGWWVTDEDRQYIVDTIKKGW